MAESRVQPMRLKEWLLHQIDSGRYPGLRWENPEKTMFRIPWKHAAKQDYKQQADAALFKAWAMYKGKFREGSGRADPSVWKTRLRCALNKSPDFQEVMENSQLDLSEPYKLYRIVSPTEERNGEGDKETSVSPTKDLLLKETQKPIVGECKSSIKKEETQAPIKELSQYPSQEDTEKPEMEQVFEIQVHKRQGSPEPYRSKSLRTDTQHLPKSTSCPSPIPFLWTTQHSDYRVLDLSTRNEGLPSSSSLSDFWLHVRLYYQDKLVTEVTTKTAEGCRIVPWSAAPQQFSPYPSLSLEVVSLPYPSELPDNLTPDMNAMQNLLKHLERGVLLWVAPEGVFVKRQCQIRVYWNGQLAPHSNQPNKLEREKTCKVLDTEQFLHDLQMYVTQEGPEPQYQIQLCFGEEYPDTSRVNTKILMMALVEPVFARELLLNAKRKVIKDPKNPDLQPPGASSAPTPPI